MNVEKIQKKIMYMEELYEKVQLKFWEAGKVRVSNDFLVEKFSDGKGIITQWNDCNRYALWCYKNHKEISDEEMTLFHLLALINNFEGIQSPRVVSLLTNLERMEKILEMEKRNEYSHVKNLLFEDGTSVKNFLYHWFHLAEYYCYARKELSKEQIEVLHTLALIEDIRLSRKK